MVIYDKYELNLEFTRGALLSASLQTVRVVRSVGCANECSRHAISARGYVYSLLDFLPQQRQLSRIGQGEFWRSACGSFLGLIESNCFANHLYFDQVVADQGLAYIVVISDNLFRITDPLRIQ